MQLPPLDHVGWGRLLGAVMETGSGPERTRNTADTSTSGADRARLARMAIRENSTVGKTATDVYA